MHVFVCNDHLGKQSLTETYEEIIHRRATIRKKNKFTLFFFIVNSRRRNEYWPHGEFVHIYQLYSPLNIQSSAAFAPIYY